jgi:hypothetical protein
VIKMLTATLYLFGAGIAHPGIVEEWNEAFEQSVQVETSPPALAARNLAILHIAMHDAFAAADNQKQAALFMAKADGLPPPDTCSPLISAAAAGRTVCASLFPTRAAFFGEVLAQQLTEHHDALRGKASSLVLGRSVAQQVLTARSGDGSATTIHYVPKTEDRQWRRTTNNRPPELPHWPNVKPFALNSAAQFRPPPPPTDTAFKKDLLEVQEFGAAASTKRSEDQSEMARFWSDFNYTSTPPGHWNQIARTLTIKHDWPAARTVRLFAVLNMAMADAGLAAFDCKYQYNFWRPVTALHANGQTDWNSLLPSPSHPEYVSAHSTFSATAAAVLEQAFPTLNSPFAVQSDTLPGITRRFDTFLACEEEVGVSRVYGGIHYGFSNVEGRKLGRNIAAWVLEHHNL